MVFTGHEFADGGDKIRLTLKKHNLYASFFFTGTFYRKYPHLITQLKNDGHYLGGHSDQHLLYADWTRRDSLLVDKNKFTKDLNRNYKKMGKYGIQKDDAPFFLPPYEWYNLAISRWTQEMGLTLINYSPGTRSNADYTWPEMGDRYLTSEGICQSIMDYEIKDPNGLNGFILLLHIGTDPRRTDKFYDHLNKLINILHQKGYQFVRIDQLLK